MSDEITQTMGLDASQALQALTALDTGLSNLQNRFNSFSNTFSTFNANAGKTVSALVQITTRANDAYAALSKLASVPPPAAGGPAAPSNAGSVSTQALNSALNQTNAAATNAANAVNNLGNGATNSLGQATRAGNGFAVSLETITRVIATQLIVRSLNAVRQAVEESFQSFIKFNRAAAEIQTIIDEPINKIRDDVRSLSDEFNSPLLDVAKAKYEALSNGFDTATTSTQILTAALKFSKVGIASVSESVDLISTSLNAYSNGADHAEAISAKLFKTIELGRVVGSELANSFGRVAPIAKEIGASEDEILAAFSSITIGGVKASEAATQIRATLSALLKPSKDAEEAFRQLGVSSGEELIHARGLQGALQALISTTDGSAAATAKLFPNVRALNGVLRETGTGADEFQKHLKDIQAASAEVLNKKFNFRIESNAEQVDAAINKLKNTFTVDIGNALVTTAAKIFVFVGGVDNVTKAINALALPLAATVVSLGLYGASVGIASLKTNLLAASAGNAATSMNYLKVGLLGVIATIAAIELGSFIGDKITGIIEADLQKSKDQSAQRLADTKARIDAETNLETIAAQRRSQLISAGIAEERANYFKAEDAAKTANASIVADDKASLDKIIQAHERYATDLRRAAQQAQTDIISSEKKTNDVRAQLADTQFNFQNQRFGDRVKAFRDGQRALQLANTGQTILSQASTPTDKAAAESAFSRAEAFAQQALSTAKTSGNITAQYQAEKNLESILHKRIQAEQAYQKQRQKDADVLNKQAAEEEAKVTKLKDLTKEFLSNLNGFDKKTGDKLPQDTITKNLEKNKGVLQDIFKIGFDPKSKTSIDTLLSFDKLGVRLEQALTKTEVTQLKLSEPAVSELLTTLQQKLDANKFTISVSADPKKTATLPPGQQFTQSLADNKKLDDEFDKQKAALQARKNAEAEIAEARKRAAEADTEQGPGARLLDSAGQKAQLLTSGILNSIGTEAGGKGSQNDLFSRGLDDLEARTQKLLASTKVTKQEVINLANAYAIVAREAPDVFRTRINRDATKVEALGTIAENQDILQKQQDTGLSQPKFDEAKAKQEEGARLRALNLINQATSGIEAERQKTDGVTSATQGLNSALSDGGVSIDSLLSGMTAVADQAVRARDASKGIGTGGSSGEVTKALGGLIGNYATGGYLNYFNSGGQAKGTDTVPAMLTPGETVINAQSSRKFFSQLQAIQAGSQPIYRQQGGSVTNISVGDINVNGSGSPKTTARAVMDEIRREQRRNTANINR